MEDDSDGDIFEMYFNWFDKKKKGLFTSFKKIENDIEDEFNKILYSDESEDGVNETKIFHNG